MARLRIRGMLWYLYVGRYPLNKNFDISVSYPRYHRSQHPEEVEQLSSHLNMSSPQWLDQIRRCTLRNRREIAQLLASEGAMPKTSHHGVIELPSQDNDAD